MKSWLAVFRLRRRMETQYRGAMLGCVFCQIFFGLILIALYRALYESRPQMLPLRQVVTYVWLQQAFFRMLLSSDADLLDKIRTGSIAYDLCRPVSLYGFYYARILAQKLIGSLMRAAPMLLFACLLPPGWGIAAPESAAGLLAACGALALGLACVSAMENVTMGITMRTLDSRGVQAMLNLLMMILCGNILPLTLFPDSWQRVLTLLPYAQLLDAPIRLYTGSVPPEGALRVFALQAGWTGLIMALGLWLWKRNQRKLIVQGG